MQFEVECSVNLETLWNYIQKLSVEAIITSLPEASRQL